MEEQYERLVRDPDSAPVLLQRDIRAVSQGTSENFYRGLESRLATYLKVCRTEFEGIGHEEFGKRFLSIMNYIGRLQDGSSDTERIRRLKLAVMGTLLDVIGYNSWLYVPNSDGKLFDIAESEYRERQIEKLAAEPFYDA